MKPDDVRSLSQHLIEAHSEIVRTARRRPRQAAKLVCEEFRIVLQREDYWIELMETGEKLERHNTEADAILQDVRRLINDEAEILARLGIDQSDIGNVIADVLYAIPLAEARTGRSVEATMTLKNRLGSATDLICKHSRGPILHATDFVLSKKGAATIGALGLGAANLWFAMTADGGAISSASIKLSSAVATGQLDDLGQLLG